MINILKEKLQKIQVEKKQTLARLNMLLGAEKMLNELIALIAKQGEKKDADTDKH